MSGVDAATLNIKGPKNFSSYRLDAVGQNGENNEYKQKWRKQQSSKLSCFCRFRLYSLFSPNRLTRLDVFTKIEIGQ